LSTSQQELAEYKSGVQTSQSRYLTLTVLYILNQSAVYQSLLITKLREYRKCLLAFIIPVCSWMLTFGCISSSATSMMI